MWRLARAASRNPGLGTVLGLAALLFAPCPVRAEDAAIEKRILELEARMEATEKQNRQLEKQNRLLQLQIQQQQQIGGAEANDNRAEQGQLTEDAIRKMIADYMKQDAANKKKGDDAKKNEFTEIVNETPLTTIFDDGFLLRSKNKAFTARVGCEEQMDMVFMGAPYNVQYGNPALNSIANGHNGTRNGGGIGPVEDGVNSRRTRIDFRGIAWDNFEWLSMWDFGYAQTVGNQVSALNNNGPNLNNAFGVLNGNQFNTPQPIEMWGLVKNLPIVRSIRIGNQKPLYSFEDWNSSRFQNFMERSLGWDAFAENQNNGFHPGICMLNWTENERMSYQAGIFKNNHSLYWWHEQNGGDSGEARVTFLPWYCDNGRYLIHLGCGSMFADASTETGQNSGVVRFRQRTLLRPTNNAEQDILTEVRFNANTEWRLVPEFYMNLGPFNLQSELYLAGAGGVRTIATYGNPSRNIGQWMGYSYYVQVGYYITGEYNPYNKQLGRLERPIPHTNFFTVRNNAQRLLGSGLWWTGFRYSFINLNGMGGVNGAAVGPNGAQQSSANVYGLSYSLMWILNPNVRIIADAEYMNRNPANTPESYGAVRGFGMRFQYDF